MRPLGGTTASEVDLRVVAATQVDLDQSGFRRDLLARLGDWTLQLPSLRERKADLPEAMQRRVRDRPTFSPAQEITSSQHESTLPMPVVRVPPVTVSPVESAEATADSFQEGDDRSMATLEDPKLPDRARLEEALRRAKGNVSLVAEQNGWHRTQVYRWIRRAGLNPKLFR